MNQEEILAAIAGIVVLLLLVGGGAAVFIFKGSGDAQKTEEEPAADDGGGGGRANRRDAAARRRQREAAQAPDANAAPPPPAEMMTKKEDREDQEAAELARLEKERSEHEKKMLDEAEKWKDSISVQKEGTGAEDLQEQEGLLQDFIEYIKTHKCVELANLAAEFGMKVQDVIARINYLDESRQIFGILDDRGKYIYMTEEEMKKVADYVRSKGRVSVQELSAKSPMILDLEKREIKVDTSVLGLDMDDDADADSPKLVMDDSLLAAAEDEGDEPVLDWSVDEDEGIQGLDEL